MHRLPRPVRSALLRDRSNAGLDPTTATVSWSLQRLASLNNDVVKKQKQQGTTRDGTMLEYCERCSDGAKLSSRTNDVARSRGRLRRRLLPHKQAAETLLRGVQVRVAQQQYRCLRMISRLEMQQKKLSQQHRGDHLNSNAGQTCPSVCQVRNEERSKTAMVRAVNQVIDRTLIDCFHVTEQVQEEMKKALKALRDLDVMHCDTYRLTYDLLRPEDGRLRIDYGSEGEGNGNELADRSVVLGTFEQIRSRHALTVEALADIVSGLRRAERRLTEVKWRDERMTKHNNNHNDAAAQHRMDAQDSEDNWKLFDEGLVESFLRGRLMLQLLCDHYVSYAKYGLESGGVSVNCNLVEVIQDAVTEASRLCEASLGVAPEVRTNRPGQSGGRNDSVKRTVSNFVDEKTDLTMPLVQLTLIRPWLHHTLVELLKNAMASSVKKSIALSSAQGNGGARFVSPPDVSICIVDDAEEESITCSVIDQGVGLGRTASEINKNEHAFKFAETLSERERWDRLNEQQSYAAVRPPLDGLGVGLTLSRMMMRMFGGDVLLSAHDVEEGGVDNLTEGCTATVILRRDTSIPENHWY